MAGLFLMFSFCSDQQSPFTEPEPVYTCSWNGVDTVKFLYSLSCPQEFSELEGPPIMQTMSEVGSVKLVYEIAGGRIYYVSTKHFRLHFDFCREVLGYRKSHGEFNDEQYGKGPERLYYLASIHHYKSSGIYTLEFFADDGIDAEGIRTTFQMAQESSFLGEKLKFFPNSTKLQQHIPALRGIPVIHEEDLYGGQRYQALNTGVAYGWLRKVDITKIGSEYLGRHDILVVNGLPIDIPVIAGIITSVFQTPLSHINVLSHNRKTPNMALKTAWTDPRIQEFQNKLVYLSVTSDSFAIREASLEEAEAFWKSREPSQQIVLLCEDDSSGLFDMDMLSHQSISFVGAKAANFAELMKIRMDGKAMPVPEGAFAIPFYYYREHLKQHGLDKYVEWMLQDSLFKASYSCRLTSLRILRDSIIHAKLDPGFVRAVESKIRSLSAFTSIRFRSSTNVEDIEGFNGAGLYESYTAVLGDREKTIEKAIKRVFASIWTLRGFEEREYFKIDQLSAAMGILVHRAFPHEEANGVAITGNIYYPYVPGYTINVQVKDISVVQPPPGFTADLLLFYTYNTGAFENPAIEYISHSNVNNGEPVLTIDETVELARWLTAIQYHFYYNVYRTFRIPLVLFTMDVEFKRDGDTRKLYIKQGRPY